MPGRTKKRDKAIAKFFRDLRTARGIAGLRQAALIAYEKGFRKLTLNTLGALERGETQHTDPEVLRELSRFYGVDYGDLVVAYAATRYEIQRDLTRHEGDQGSDFQVGRSDAAASAAQARILELETALKDARNTIAATQEIARQLFNVVLPAEGRAPRKGKPTGGKTDRAAS